MEVPGWSLILSRIVPQDADDLDAVVGPYDPRRNPVGKELFPEVSSVLAPQTPMKRADAVCVGLRVTGHLRDAADRALRLAAFAAERDVQVVVLAYADNVGLERFGFRVERVAGATEADRARCEDQLRRFWNLDLVL